MNPHGPRPCLARACLLALLLALPLFSGCGTMTSFGRRPDTALLESALKMRVSTKTDVLDALGTPRNTGAVMFPGHDRPRDLWCYYYEESTVVEYHRLFLFVFFDDGLYDGYMWFSSLPRAAPPPPAAPPNP